MIVMDESGEIHHGGNINRLRHLSGGVKKEQRPRSSDLKNNFKSLTFYFFLKVGQRECLK